MLSSKLKQGKKRKRKKNSSSLFNRYMPSVGDSKRALDEYYCEIFMGGRQTIAMHNTCEDSLLAAPLIIDLCVLAELHTRLQVAKPDGTPLEFHPIMSLLS